MDKIWLKSYPTGVPAEVRWDEYHSAGELAEACMAKYRERAAYESMGRTLAFGELERLSGHFCAWLQGRGIAKGARVALMMPNILPYPVALFGALRAGCAVVNVNPLYRPPELERQLCDSGAGVIVVLENCAATVAQVRARTPLEHVVITSMGDLLGPKRPIVKFLARNGYGMPSGDMLPGAVRFDRALSEGARARMERVTVDPEDVAFLQYTGGTTGTPKGAMLTHANVLANVEQIRAWYGPFLDPESHTVLVVTPLPLSHIFSLTANCLAFMKMGGCNLLIPDASNIGALVKELESHRWEAMTGVTTLFKVLLRHPRFRKLDFTSVKLVVAGGMALEKAVAERWKELTGTALLQGYGLTETSPVVTGSPGSLMEANGSAGLPLPSTDIQIRDGHGREVITGEAGELFVRGPQVMKGYWRRPEETAQVIGSDGFLATGDIATMDAEGFVRIVDRKKNVINVSGFKVFAREVEAVVSMHPGVLDVAAVGVPDPRSGEAVKLIVVRRDPQLGEKEIREFCAERMTGYKHPKYVEFAHELPRARSGEVLRNQLASRSGSAGQPSRPVLPG